MRIAAQDGIRAGEIVDPVAEDASAPDVLDSKADQRDKVAAARDEAADARNPRIAGVVSPEQIAELQMLAARDRAAAALDRREAALDRHRAAEYLQRAYRDELTGALHRRAGRDQLAREVGRAQRSEDDLVIAFLDVVHLKHVNDTYGHDAGDTLLAAVGTALRTCLRSYDVIVRYGGDEFVCALPNATLGVAMRRFEDVSRVLAMASPEASFSIGLAQFAAGETLDDLVRRADWEMYNSRRAQAASGGPRGS